MIDFGNGELNEKTVRKNLNSNFCKTVEIHKILDSTNNRAKLLAKNGAPEGTLVIAEEQSAGRGRNGKSFFSPAKTGLYMSLLLRPHLNAESFLCITAAASVAVAEAVMLQANIKTEIKWVNDVLANGKKLCGILTEGQSKTGGEVGLSYAIVGIGINLFNPENGFPEEIEKSAASLLGKTARSNKKITTRSKLAAEVINRFFYYYELLPGKAELLEKYREFSIVTGKEIFVISPGGEREAKAVSINDNFELNVIYENGERATLTGGEISIKVK